MIPAWKVRREWDRFKQQLRSLPEALWEPRAARRYDAAFPRQLTIVPGTAGPSAQVALLLIYPVPALPESTVRLCQSMQTAGFAPLVVSNAPLDARDRARLLPHVWHLVERPNLGHDFGGYRDGLRLLRDWDSRPDEILILNDSVWLVDNDVAGLVRRLRGLGADVAGSILRERGAERFLESYCYLMRGDVARQAAMTAYWDGLVLTSNKYKVIRNGERGHSAALLKAGHVLKAAFTEDGFLAALKAAPTELLERTLEGAAWPSPALLAGARAVLQRPRTDPWRAQALAYLQSGLAGGQFYSLYPVAAQSLLGYPFLKRSGDRVGVLWRRAYLSAVDRGFLTKPTDVVLAELRASVARDSTRTDVDWPDAAANQAARAE